MKMKASRFAEFKKKIKGSDYSDEDRPTEHKQNKMNSFSKKGKLREALKKHVNSY